MVRVWDVHMRHLIGNLNYEDSIVKKHFVPHRLFKIEDDLYYDEVEHPILLGNFKEKGFCDITTIFHLAYISEMFSILKRYKNHVNKSNIHTPEYLIQWRNAHYFNTYPKKQFNPIELPSIILKEFGINKDELYFSNRQIDLKHPIMVKQWYDHFKPKSVLCLGCGRGPYLYFWKWFVENSKGIELSQWAVNVAFCNDIKNGDICSPSLYEEVDLITAIDVLEHLSDDELNLTLKNMSDYGNKFIFSIPFEGDPNLLLDKTHKQFHTRGWWIDKIKSYGINVAPAPVNWQFHEQILVGVK